MKEKNLNTHNAHEVLFMEIQKLDDFINEHYNYDFTLFYNQLPDINKKFIQNWLNLHDSKILTNITKLENPDFKLNNTHIYFTACYELNMLYTATIISINKLKPKNYPKRFVQLNLAVQKYFEN